MKAMKVFELIAHLQQMPPDADTYIGWTEMNDSGTCFDTGTVASHVEKEIRDRDRCVVVIR